MENLKKREIKLLRLLSNRALWKADDLAKELNVSEKTIRSDIKNIERIADNHGAHISIKSGVGITTEIFDEEKFQVFLKNLEMNPKEIPVGPDERVERLLYKLINSKDYLKVNDLCKEWFVSEKMLQQDLKKIEQYISKYGLSLDKTNSKMKIVGKESQLRRCLTEMELKKDDSGYEFVSEITMKVLERYNFKISDALIENLIQHMIVSITRIKKGNYIVTPIEDEQIHDCIEFEIASEITNEIASVYGVVFSLYEIEYLTTHLMSKKVVQNESNFVVNAEIDELITNIFDVIYKTYEIDFSKNFDLRVSLGLHFEPLMHRLKFNLGMKNPLLQKIKENYSYAYAMALVANTVIVQKYEKSLSEDEIGYIALSFELALETTRKRNKKRNIILVCNLGQVSTALLKHKYLELFGEYIDEIYICSVHELKHMNFSKYDYIFTTVPITEYVPLPIFKIQYFIDPKDVENLKSNISEIDTNVIHKYFRKELFLPEVEATSKEEAIQIMSQYLESIYSTECDLYASIMNRENLGSTDFCYKSAMPHTDRFIYEETKVVVGILKDSIIWNTNEVQVVFMIAIGKDKKDNQVFYNVLSKFMLDKNKIHKLLAHKDYEEFIEMLNDVLKEYEKKRTK